MLESGSPNEVNRDWSSVGSPLFFGMVSVGGPWKFQFLVDEIKAMSSVF